MATYHRMRELVLRQFIAAPVEAVWSVATDHCGLGRWLVPGAKVHLDPEGSPTPNGAGAVRVIETMGYKTIERVIDFEPHRRMTYTVQRGFPVHDHLGEMLLDEADGGTEVVWTVRFRPKLPGTGPLLALVVRQVIGGGLKRLARLPFEAKPTD